VHTRSVDSIDVAADETGLTELSDTERAVYGFVTPLELRAFLDAWTRVRLGSPIVKVPKNPSLASGRRHHPGGGGPAD
jgi:hypothetical protein